MHEHPEPVDRFHVEVAELPVDLQRRPHGVGHLIGPYEQIERIGDPWGVAQTSARVDVEAQRTVGAARRCERQAVQLHRGAVGRAAGHDDLPLARQERRQLLLVLGERSELLEQRRDREVATRVGVVGRAGGRVPHRVAARLRARHADRVETPPDLGQLRELHPVHLDVLARRDLAEPVGLDVVLPAVAEVADHARDGLELVGVDLPTGDADPQHEPVALAVVVHAHQAHAADGERALPLLDLVPRIVLVGGDLGLDRGADLGRPLRPIEDLRRSLAHRALPLAGAVSDCACSLSDFVPSSCTEQWMPHSLLVSSSHHQRPARSDSPGRTARVHGEQPIEV